MVSDIGFGDLTSVLNNCVKYKSEIPKDAKQFSEYHNIKTTTDLILAQSIVSSPVITVHKDTMKYINTFIALVAFMALLSPLASSEELRSRELKSQKGDNATGQAVKSAKAPKAPKGKGKGETKAPKGKGKGETRAPKLTKGPQNMKAPKGGKIADKVTKTDKVTKAPNNMKA